MIPHEFIPMSWFRKDWRDERMDDDDDGAGLISERLGLMGSAAVGEIVQTRHVVCRKSMRGALYRDKINRGNAYREGYYCGNRKKWLWMLDDVCEGGLENHYW